MTDMTKIRNTLLKVRFASFFVEGMDLLSLERQIEIVLTHIYWLQKVLFLTMQTALVNNLLISILLILTLSGPIFSAFLLMNVH